MTLLSVLIACHNPRPEFIAETLTALRRQTLPVDQWELLLVDNANDPPLRERIDLSWHPHHRHVIEPELGTLRARVAGIRTASSPVIVMVDDDNVLDDDYLEVGLRIGDDWPILGAWGGSLSPGFEREPEEWTRDFWGLLAIRTVDSPRWSNLLHQYESTPVGAGMFVRTATARRWVALVEEDPSRAVLGAKGERLLRCEDSDLAFVACDVGEGVGVFPELHLTHLMPAERLEEPYLLQMVEGHAYSLVHLNAFRGIRPRPDSLPHRLWLAVKKLRMPARARRFLEAEVRGRTAAIGELAR